MKRPTFIHDSVSIKVDPTEIHIELNMNSVLNVVNKMVQTFNTILEIPSFTTNKSGFSSETSGIGLKRKL